MGRSHQWNRITIGHDDWRTCPHLEWTQTKNFNKQQIRFFNTEIIMTEEVLEDAVPIKQINNQPGILKDIILGICLFVGMNLLLMLAGHILGGLFWNIVSGLFNISSHYSPYIGFVKFAAIFFINVAVFIYLIVKRPRMIIGLLAGIPVLLLILLLLFLALWIFIIAGWFGILFLDYMISM